MLPIENENYGMLYSFQPDYLAQLISDDRDPPNPTDNAVKTPASVWAVITDYARRLFK